MKHGRPAQTRSHARDRGWPIASAGILLLLAAVNVFVAASLFGFTLLNDERARQRQEMEREAGILQERQRLAREIHDTLAQGLTGIVAQLRGGRPGARQRRRRHRHLDAAAQLARDSLNEARRSVRAIGPGELEGARLPDALAQVTDSWTARTNVPAALHHHGRAARPLHPEVEVTLLRAAQEALTNVGQARRGDTASASRCPTWRTCVTLDVRDDGVGFEPTPRGFGLTGMHQRVHGVGGALAVESAPGEGTAISASVPAVPA